MASEDRQAFDHAISQMSDLGADVIEVRSPLFEMPGMIGPGFAAEVAALHGAWFADPQKQYGEDVAIRIQAAIDTPTEQIAEANRWRMAVRNAFISAFDDVDFLLTPAVPARGKVIGEDIMRYDGTEHFYRKVVSWFSSLVNQAGLPALVAPLNAPGSPPPSLQLIGPHWSEHSLLEFARKLPEDIIRFRPPPTLP